MRPWYKITALADPTIAELHVFDEIGKSFFNDEAVTAEQFLSDLAALPESVTTLRVLVNSPGGNPWEATTIANALRAQRQEKGRIVEVQIVGLAASAATIITSAGDPIRMAENATLMVHNPTAIVLGDAREMTKMAAALGTVKGAIIATYRWVSKLSAEQLGRLMDEETWMSAEMAVQHGFATEVMAGDQGEVAASLRPEALARLGQVPDSYRERIAALVARPAPAPPPPAPTPPPALDRETMRAILAEASAAGFPQVAAALFAEDDGVTLDRARARLVEAQKIRALCREANLAQLVDSYIEGRVPVPIVQRQLSTLVALLAGEEIDTGLPPEMGRGDAGSSWARAIKKAQQR